MCQHCYSKYQNFLRQQLRDATQLSDGITIDGIVDSVTKQPVVFTSKVVSKHTSASLLTEVRCDCLSLCIAGALHQVSFSRIVFIIMELSKNILLLYSAVSQL